MEKQVRPEKAGLTWSITNQPEHTTSCNMNHVKVFPRSELFDRHLLKNKGFAVNTLNDFTSKHELVRVLCA